MPLILGKILQFPIWLIPRNNFKTAVFRPREIDAHTQSHRIMKSKLNDEIKSGCFRFESSTLLTLSRTFCTCSFKTLTATSVTLNIFIHWLNSMEIKWKIGQFHSFRLIIYLLINVTHFNVAQTHKSPYFFVYLSFTNRLGKDQSSSVAIVITHGSSNNRTTYKQFDVFY